VHEVNDKDYRDQVAARVVATLTAGGLRPEAAAVRAYAVADAMIDERSGAAKRRRDEAAAGATDLAEATRQQSARFGPTADVNSPPTRETHPATTPQPADGLVAEPGVLTGVPEEGRNPEATEVMSSDEHATAEALARASHLPIDQVEKPVSTAPDELRTGNPVRRDERE
jgi:hypothetical protein